MIIYCKKDDVTGIIEKLENIEEKFWLDYKYRTESNRKFLVSQFENLYNDIYELIEGKQLELEIKENSDD